MGERTPRKPNNGREKTGLKPNSEGVVLPSEGNQQIPKGDGDASMGHR